MTRREGTPTRYAMVPAAESGSATIWVLAAGGLVLAAGLLAAVLGMAVLTRHRVEAAADLAALAAADAAVFGPGVACGDARRVAAAGAGTLTTCTLSNGVADVVVVQRGPGVLARLPAVSARSRAGPGGSRRLSGERSGSGR